MALYEILTVYLQQNGRWQPKMNYHHGFVVNTAKKRERE